MTNDNVFLKFILLFTLIAHTNTKAADITCIVTNSYSHILALQKTALEIKKQNPLLKIQCIILSSIKNNIIENPTISIHEPVISLSEEIFRNTESLIQQLIQENIHVHIITVQNKYYLHSLERSLYTTDFVLKLTKDCKLILYDFTVPEAFIVSTIKKIQSVCLVQYMLTKNNPENPYFKEKLNKDKSTIKKIKELYDVDLLDNIEFESNTYTFFSKDYNIIYGSKKFYEGVNFTKNRNLFNYTFAQIKYSNQTKNNECFFREIHKNKKIIYVSFGSWVCKYEHCIQFIKHILQMLSQSFANNPEYIFIISGGPEYKNLLAAPPSNFYLYESVPSQTEILKLAHIFITHCGLHSTYEAIEALVPMIAIPFHDCQHKIAQQVQNLTIGKAFLHESKNIDTAAALGIRMLKRPSLKNESLKNAILEISQNIEFYKENMKKIKEVQPQSFAEIIEDIIKEIS